MCSSAVRQVRQETINQNCLQSKAEQSGETRNENQKLQTLLRGRETGHQLTLQNTIPTVYKHLINENITQRLDRLDWMGMNGWGAVWC